MTDNRKTDWTAVAVAIVTAIGFFIMRDIDQLSAAIKEEHTSNQHQVELAFQAAEKDNLRLENEVKELKDWRDFIIKQQLEQLTNK
jgi:hypothetical protein